jgi:hypothetical protein
MEDSGILIWASCLGMSCLVYPDHTDFITLMRYTPGQDNTNSQCGTGDVSNIFEGDISDHDGPYDGVEMGC